MEAHQKATAGIQHRIKQCYAKQIPFHIYHGSTNSTRPTRFNPDEMVDTSTLDHVIHVDRERKTAIVEPNVPMDQLVPAMLQHGLLPPVVPEFPGITVGGSFCGTAGESSSFKHGYFDRTVNWMEIVLANGDLVKCSPTDNPELFYGSVGAFGTLGVATLFEIQLIPAGRYVEVTYLPVRSVAESISLVRSVVKESFDYVDGILYSPTLGAVVVARTTDERIYPLRRLLRPKDPWFYLHVKSQVKKSESRPLAPESTQFEKSPQQNFKDYPTETIPITDYLFRYDRGAFWMGRYGFSIFHAPFTSLSRFAVDPLMRTRKLYQAMHLSGHASHFIIQDLALPADRAEEFIKYVDVNLGIYPLWLCPIRNDPKAPFHRLPNQPADATSTNMVINVGVWGPPSRPYTTSDADIDRFVEDNRRIEKKVMDLGGIKWLYARNFYTEQEFWDIFDRESYEECRKRWNAESLPDVWSKVGKKRDDPLSKNLSKMRGIVGAIMDKNSLLTRKSSTT